MRRDELLGRIFFQPFFLSFFFSPMKQGGTEQLKRQHPMSFIGGTHITILSGIMGVVYSPPRRANHIQPSRGTPPQGNADHVIGFWKPMPLPETGHTLCVSPSPMRPAPVRDIATASLVLDLVTISRTSARDQHLQDPPRVGYQCFSKLPSASDRYRRPASR